MTLIVTLVSDAGIVQASDSNLSKGDGSHAGTGTKVFHVPYHDAALAFSGLYEVGGESVDSWMPRALDECAREASLAEVATALKVRFEQDTVPDERSIGYLVHLAGYERDGDDRYPVLWFLRNIPTINPDGSYSPGEQDFLLTEDLWSRDRPASQGKVDPVLPFLYANGTPEARTNFMEISTGLLRHLKTSVWTRPGWLFHAPRNAEELALVAEFLVRGVTTLFKVSDYAGPPVGGEVQNLAIEPPERTRSLHAPT